MNSPTYNLAQILKDAATLYGQGLYEESLQSYQQALQLSLPPDPLAQQTIYSPGRHVAGTEARLDLFYQPTEPPAEVYLTIGLPFVDSEESLLWLDLSHQSWLGTPQEVMTEAVLAEAGTQLLVHLWGIDGMPQWATKPAWLAQVGGIIVEVEEVQWRRADPEDYRLYPSSV